jgi:hypothetical protein
MSDCDKRTNFLFSWWSVCMPVRPSVCESVCPSVRVSVLFLPPPTIKNPLLKASLTLILLTSMCQYDCPSTCLSLSISYIACFLPQTIILHQMCSRFYFSYLPVQSVAVPLSVCLSIQLFVNLSVPLSLSLPLSFSACLSHTQKLFSLMSTHFVLLTSLFS